MRMEREDEDGVRGWVWREYEDGKRMRLERG